MYLMRAAAWFSGNDYASLLLRERGAPARVRHGDRRLSLAPRRLAGAVVRARPDAAGVRHDQLGSRGGGARDGGARRVREATRRLGGRADRARRGDEVLPGAGAGPAVPAGAPGSASRIARSGSCGGRRARGSSSTCRSRSPRPAPWWEFFRFNASRTPDFDSIWYIACRHVDALCISIDNVEPARADGVPRSAFIAIYSEGPARPVVPAVGAAACRC